MNSKLLYPCFFIFSLIVISLIKTAQGINSSPNILNTKNVSDVLLLAQTDSKDDIESEIEELSQEDEDDIQNEFEESLESDLEGSLEVDEADLIDEELIDIEREEEKTEEARIEEEFEAQQAEAEAAAEAEIEEELQAEEEEEQEPTETAQEEAVGESLEEEFEQSLEDEFEQLAEDESPAESIAEDEDLIEIEDSEDPLFADEEEEEFEQLAEDESPGPPLYITAVDFLHDQKGGSIVIKTTGVPDSPSIRRSEDGTQVIVELDNVRLPDQFKRPYTTKEFPSNIGFFQAYQENEASKVRFVVQVREPVEPLVRIEGNSILIEAQSSSLAEQDSGLGQPSLTQTEGTSDTGETMATGSGVGQSLTASSSEDFLLKNTKFTGEPISIEVNNADIRDVLEFITNESGLNIIFAESVKGSVTLKLREIPWDQAFILILQMKKLGYIKNGDIVIVDTVSAIQSEIKERQALLDSKKNLEPLRIQILPINYAKAQEMISKIQVFKSQRGQIQADPRTNALIITDIDENIQRMKALIRSLDVQIPQVLIEGKIIEANETFSRQFGLAVEGSNLNATIKNFSMKNSSGGTQQLSLDLKQIVGLNAGTLGAIFDVLENQQVLRVLSSPRIVTLNNMGASIQQSTQIPIPKAESTGGGVTASTEYKDITFSLNVTPQVTSGESIILQISIQRQSQGASTGEGGAPIVSGRSANTNIMVNDGDTAVIGGIYETSTSNTSGGVPILRSIPLIGALFKTNVRETSKTELLIFLTPRVLNRNETFALSRSEDEIINEEDINEIELDLEEEFDTF